MLSEILLKFKVHCVFLQILKNNAVQKFIRLPNFGNRFKILKNNLRNFIYLGFLMNSIIMYQLHLIIKCFSSLTLTIPKKSINHKDIR